MKIKRLFTFLIALTIVASTVACANTSTADDTSVPDADSGAQSDTDPKDTRYTPNLPDMTFDGADFNVYGIMDVNYYDITYKFDAEEGSGDVIENAIYKRNQHIEEVYDLNFVYTTVDHHAKPQGELQKNAMADENVYDLYMMICRQAFAAAQNGYITPVNSIPYLDLTAPWYLHDINEQFSIDGKLFFAYSAECLNLYSQSTVVFYNQKLVNDYKIPSLYETVNNGEWTIDKMLEYARLVKSSSDLGTDTVYGISSEFDNIYPALWVGSDTRLIEKDEDDIPAYTLPKNEKLLGLLELSVELIKETNLIVDGFLDFTPSGRTQGDILFSENKALFRISALGTVFNLRNMDADFGIIPLPKYNAEQENYVGRMCDGWIYVVPTTNDRLDMTGIVLESLAAESMNTTIPAFYEVALESKLTRDEESSQMLDIIFNNMTVDLGDTVWYDTLRVKLTDVIKSRSAQFASKAEELKNSVEAAIRTAIEALEDQ